MRYGAVLLLLLSLVVEGATAPIPMRLERPDVAPPDAVPPPRLTGSEPSVTVRVNAGVEEALRALTTAGPGGPAVVVADDTSLKPTLSRPLGSAPLSDALSRISEDFDRCWLRRGRALVLQRRFFDPDEAPASELEELQQTAADLDRLLQPFAPPLAPVQTHYATEEFEDSLTPGQQQQMQTRTGLPFSALAPHQKQLWSAINQAKGFAAITREAHRLHTCLSAWKQLVVRDLEASSTNLPHQERLSAEVADPAASDGIAAVLLVVPGANLNRRPTRSLGYWLAPLNQSAPAPMKVAWNLPLRSLTLGALATELQRDGGPVLQVPEYAKGRRLWVYSREASRWEVLNAVADLWGWQVIPDNHETFRLGRARIAPARDVFDLARKVRAVIPPGVAHEIPASQESSNLRRRRQLDLVLAEAVTAAGKNWSTFRPASLSAASQARLANVLALRVLEEDWYTEFGRAAEPYGWMSAPERGVFHLDGPIGRGHPFLSFAAPDSQGRALSWGLWIGTGTNLRRQH